MPRYGPYDDETCAYCGSLLDESAVLDERSACAPCDRKLDDAFIAAFGLVENEHFEKDAAGNITFWRGDATLIAASAWMTACQQVGPWEDALPAELVAMTRAMAALWPGGDAWPAPFGLTDADEGEDA
jgi:hypothetical protein